MSARRARVGPGSVGAIFRDPDRQRVHVGAEGYGRTGLLALQVRQQPGPRDSGPHGEFQGPEQFFDGLRGMVLLEAQLGFPVEIAPDLDQLRLKIAAHPRQLLPQSSLQLAHCSIDLGSNMVEKASMA